MKLRRFFFNLENHNINIGESIAINKELNNRIFNVLRLTNGTNLELITENKILKVEIDNKQLLIRKIKEFESKKNKITLIVSLIEKARFDIIVEKATELNADFVLPMITERTKPFGKKGFEKATQRWQKIADQSLSQCYRNSRLIIQNPKKFKDIIIETTKNKKENSLNLILSTKKDINTKKIIQEIKNNLNTYKDIRILIGPEGGFTDEEEKLAIENGFTPLSLAQNTLRTETACISVLSILEFLK